MKKSIITIIATLLVALTVQAQSPTPLPSASPTPFDSLGVSMQPTPPSRSVAAQQKQFRQSVAAQSRSTFMQMVRAYQAIYDAVYKDDSANGGLKPAQKQAALTDADKTELLTNAWLLANMINGIHAGTVQNPPTQ